MKPILFNTEMVRSILTGHKTVTRRVVKPQPEKNNFIYKHHCGKWFISTDDDALPETNVKAPYQTGSILYVRETWLAMPNFYTDGRPAVEYLYKADMAHPEEYLWHPSIHMPSEAARIFLRVTDVRVEKLQNITDDGVEKEGVPIVGKVEKEARCLQAFSRFPKIWNSTIKPKDRDLYGWEANPWVWVIEFERCEKPEEVHE